MEKYNFDRSGNELVAHARTDDRGNWIKPHLLIDHLHSTGELAYEFSEKFCSGYVGKTLGLLHDLGKTALIQEEVQRILI